MNRTEAEKALPTLIDAWAKETNQPMPPNGQHHYSFASFYGWLQEHYPSYTIFKALPDPRYMMEMWFDRIMKQA
jgi:hypothetical protein